MQNLNGGDHVANGRSELDREGCEFGRSLRAEVGRMQEDVAKILEKFDALAARPTWGIATTIVLLTNLVVALLVLQVKGG